MAAHRISSGTLLVVVLMAFGIAGTAGTWWNYMRFHPSTQEAFLSKLDPPLVEATFSTAIPFKTYAATVTINGGKMKYAGRTQGWKKLEGGANSAEILLDSKPDAALRSRCAVTLDLEIKPTSN